MNRPHLRAAAMLAVIALPAQAALAMDDATAWANWVARGKAIIAVFDGGPPSSLKREQMKAACQGTMGSMIGHSYPLWAQGLIGLCRNLPKFVDGQAVDIGSLRGNCQELKYTRGQFHDAKDVPGSPEVLPTAQKLSQITDFAYDRYCTKEGRKSMQEAN